MKFSKMGDAGPYFSLLLKLGTIMVVNILLFFFIGLLLDKWFSLKGVFIIIAVFLGVGIGFFYVFKELKKLNV